MDNPGPWRPVIIRNRWTAIVAAVLLVAACESKASTPPGSQADQTTNPAGSAAIAGSGGPGSSGAGQGSAQGSPGSGGQSVSGGAPAITGAAVDSLSQLEQAYEAVVERVSPSVVVIETTDGLGSGVVFDSGGDIVTNAHVVGSSTRFTVTTFDGRQLQGTLVGTFAANDIAVIKVGDGNLRTATFADSTRLKVGQIVLAVGNPLGLQSSVTNGIVSSLGRTVAEPGGATLPGLIQTSASINPGNSGGALVDIHGDVVGIPTLAAVDPQIGAAAPGIGFAIPSNDAKDFAGQLIQGGKVTNSHRAYLGIRSADVSGQGVLVYAVVRGGPADQAGIKPGQLITSIADKPTPDAATLSAVLASLQPGQDVTVVVMSDNGRTSTVHVKLGTLPG